MIRSLRVSLWTTLLVLSLVVTAGCSRPSGTSAATPATPVAADKSPVPANPAPKTAALPYDQLLYLTGAEVKERMGEPSDVKTKGKGATWRYEHLKLEISLFEDMVHRVDADAGLITEGLAVGDDEARVQALTTKVESGSPGIKVYTLHRDQHWYLIATRENKIMSAAIEVPSSP